MGYSSELFLDKPIDEEFVCSICQDVLQDPVMIEQCEHIFCSSCLSSWSQQSQTCPMDREAIVSSRPPHRGFINMLHRLRLTCKNADKGCTDILTLGGLVDHDGQCQGNPELVRKCAMDCGASFKLVEAASHDCVSYLKAQLKSRDEDIDRLKFDNTRLSARGEGLQVQSTQTDNQPTPHMILGFWRMIVPRAYEIRDALAQMLVSSGAEIQSLNEICLKYFIKIDAPRKLWSKLPGVFMMQMFETGREQAVPFYNDDYDAEHPGIDISYGKWTIRMQEEDED